MMGKNKFCVAKFTIDLAEKIKNLPGAYILYDVGELYKLKSIAPDFLVIEEYKDGIIKLVPKIELPTLIRINQISIVLPLELKDLFSDIEILLREVDIDLGMNYEEMY